LARGLTGDAGDECVDFIRQNKKGPFFLYAAFGAPQSPMQATDEDLKLVAHVEDKLRRTYCARVHRLDQNVGKILQALKGENLERNTVVVFMRDNGGPCAAPISNGSVNAPLRGQKTTLLEGDIRVPLILRWPQKTTAGTRIDPTVSALDLCPTFVPAAGGSFASKEDTGIDLLPLIMGNENQLPPRSLKWTYPVSWAIRERDWKLIRLPERLPMLFNLSDDVSEESNVARLNLSRTEAMLKKLGTWEVRLPHPVFREPAHWRIRHLGFYDADYRLIQPE
jgi:arylsulfatase A-like enzyme